MPGQINLVICQVFSQVSFHLTLHCQPISTLFPYTTLFRSQILDADLEMGFLLLSDLGQQNLYHALMDGIDFVGPEDRKSTRLNSSHVAISYAVFCLKKKK